MRKFGRRAWLTVLIVFLAPVAARALLLPFQAPRDWRIGRWSSAGILPEASSDAAARLTVFAARTFGWRGVVAVHSWIVLKPAQGDHYTRYEVTGFGQPIRVNGAAPDGYWIGAKPDVVADRSGASAAEAIPKIEAAIRDYPYAESGSYRLWPGPNSNTFIATLLRAVPELGVELPPDAIGKDFRADGALAGLTDTGTGVEVSLYGLLGIKIGRVEGIKVNVLDLVAGLDVQRPALKVPAFGLIGFDRLTAAPAAAGGGAANR
jgi:hypothetical protein